MSRTSTQPPAPGGFDGLPLGPAEALRQINAGHCLSAEELDKLKAEAEASMQRELEDPNYAKACRRCA